jgi:2-polyprenyl-3-methyl-5-hydroxy-6-metoxy-1,4-benzoquinol methylase
MLAEQQEAIYEKVYTKIPVYGMKNHALLMDHTIAALLNINDCRTVLDAGCGRGQFIEKFEGLGFEVEGVDITLKGILNSNILDLVTKLPLWELPDKQYDAVICFDVLEHIPEEKVLEVINRLARATRKIAIMKIAHYKEMHGPLVGEDLHPTIKTSEEWAALLGEHYEVSYLEMNSHDTTYYLRK